MTWRAALDGREESCIARYLEATELRVSDYERMGYRAVTTLPIWRVPRDPWVRVGQARVRPYRRLRAESRESGIMRLPGRIAPEPAPDASSDPSVRLAVETTKPRRPPG